MEGFMVDTTNVNNCANDIQGYGDRIKDLKDSVRSIRLGMRHKLSAREQIDRTLLGIEDRMLDEAALMSSLDQALEHIAETYRSTERKLVTEGIRRSAGGQAVTEQQQAMMDQYMQAAIFDILQEDQFSQEAWENASIEERKEILNSFLDRMEKEMGISLEDIQFRSGEDLGYNGAYNYADNYIALNEEILNTGDPSGAMTTLMHEARHAYQHAACENPDQFLVTADTIQGWQDSSDNYKSYLQDGKYSDILSEIDAHDFAGQELKKGYVPLAGGIGDGAEMYSIKAEVSDVQYWVEKNGVQSWENKINMDFSDTLIAEYGLVKIDEGLGYDTYTGYIVREDGTIKPGRNDNSNDLNLPDMKEGVEKVTFYIGKGYNRGAVKIDRGFLGVWGAENVYAADSGKKIERVIKEGYNVGKARPSRNTNDLLEGALQEYGPGFGLGNAANLYQFMKYQSLDPERAINGYLGYVGSQIKSTAKGKVDPTGSLNMSNDIRAGLLD